MPQTWHHHFESFSPFLSCRITSTDTEHYLWMGPQCTVNARWHVILISSTAIEVSYRRRVGHVSFLVQKGLLRPLYCNLNWRDEVGKKRGRNINGIDLQSSLSCIRDAGRNHTISAHCTTPMSFRSIEIDPCTKGLGLSGCVPIGRAQCVVLHFHHNTFWMQDPVIQLQITFI